MDTLIKHNQNKFLLSVTSPLRVIFEESVADVTVVELLASQAAGGHAARAPCLGRGLGN